MREGHLSAEQVLEILEIVQEQDAILIGGQAVNLWAEWYSATDAALEVWRPYTSKDVDFYQNHGAATRLANILNGTMHVPKSMDDATPNAATVVGSLGDKHVEIDFLKRVLGVEDEAIVENYVTILGTDQTTGQPVRILVLSPLDCLRSRLSNLNILRRREAIAVNQGRASVVVLKCFVDELLREGAFRKAQTTLTQLATLIRTKHIGMPSDLEHDLRPETVLHAFIDHPDLDRRWRSLILRPSIDRIEQKLTSDREKRMQRAQAAERRAAKD
jgi:hypothetical protein